MKRSEYQANLELTATARQTSDKAANTGRVNIASGNRKNATKAAPRGFIARLLGV